MQPKKPKITPSQLNLFTEPVTDIYRALEDEIFMMVANAEDYIIKGVEGEIYPCKTDIFKRTYEKIKK